MGALLDIRIMELTQGEKDLHDIILTLRDKYGPNESFNDDEIIEEFVSLVHPDLHSFSIVMSQGGKNCRFNPIWQKSVSNTTETMWVPSLHIR